MSWVLTYTGKKFPIDQPDPMLVDPQDIATHLARINRFVGATREPYTVAQHCVLASMSVPKEHQLEALLHDAAEAYMSDIPSPVKSASYDLHLIESDILAVIFERFGLVFSPGGRGLSPCIKEIDLRLLATERRDLMPHHPDPWECLEGVEPLPIRIEPWREKTARMRFLMRLHELAELGPPEYDDAA